MSIIGWIVLGLIAGFIASKVVNKSGEGMILDIVWAHRRPCGRVAFFVFWRRGRYRL